MSSALKTIRILGYFFSFSPDFLGNGQNPAVWSKSFLNVKQSGLYYERNLAQNQKVKKVVKVLHFATTRHFAGNCCRKMWKIAKIPKTQKFAKQIENWLKSKILQNIKPIKIAKVTKFVGPFVLQIIECNYTAFPSLFLDYSLTIFGKTTHLSKMYYFFIFT